MCFIMGKVAKYNLPHVVFGLVFKFLVREIPDGRIKDTASDYLPLTRDIRQGAVHITFCLMINDLQSPVQRPFTVKYVVN